MELLLQAIEKKLANVDSERKRWLEYKTEHEQAGNNLRDFQKSFRKEILVPIGSKALMPGHLYHTNEILVSMYRGLFVKCSADKALSVCEHRICEANKRIDALNVEHKMYRDRLELPVDENIFGDLSTGAQEIIEEYNEEDEKKWREQHKIRMRAYKQAEAEERKRDFTDGDIDIDAIFERAELLEELETELELLNVESDEHLKQHLRVANDGNVIGSVDESNDQLQRTNDENETDANDAMDSEEFRALSAAAVSFNTDDKIKFFEIHLQKIREYFAKNIRSIQNINEFTEKRVTQECLENAIEELQETLYDSGNASETEQCNAITKDEEKEKAVFVAHQDSTRNTPECSKNTLDANEARKFHKRSDYEDLENEYAAQNRSKSELLVFYKGQLSHVLKLIAGCTATNVHIREQKRDLYEFLSDRITSLRDEIQKENQIKLEEDFVDDDDIDINPMKQSCRNFDVNSVPFEADDFRNDENGNSNDGKRRINFAAQPSVVTFFEDDEPCIVSQQNENSLMDATFEFFNSPSNSSASSVCDDDDDDENVEDDDDDDDDAEDNKHVRNDSDNIAESPVSSSDPRNNHLKRRNDCKNDCEMNFQMNQSIGCTINNKVIDSCPSAVDSKLMITAPAATQSQNKPTTLILQFSHSTNMCTATASNDEDTINSPLDIYQKFGSTIQLPTNQTTLSLKLDATNQACQLNMSKLLTTKIIEDHSIVEAKSTNQANGSLVCDVKTIEVPNINQKPSKSILKKKNLVDQEIRAPNIDDDDDIEDFLTDANNRSDEYPKFTQVVGEIVEHSDVNESNIKTQCNDIETAHTQMSVICNTKSQPKKRISLFKKSRMS